MHIPVLLKEIIEGFSACHMLVFVDGTVGLGGHAEAILEAHPEIELYIGFDKDLEALKKAKERLKKWKTKLHFYQGSFTQMKEVFKEEKIEEVNGVLFDFGVSSMQLDDPSRGFSFREEGPLDMRMDKSSRVSAEEVVNRFSEKKLGEIFRELGEERNWKKIAKAIVRFREKERIKTTRQLKEIVESVYFVRGKKHLHPATLTFQAIRIFVNQELKEIQEGLFLASQFLAKKGKIAAISFHSGEDRIVKNTFKDLARKKEFEAIKKPLEPGVKEVRQNRRARSAKLRWIQKEA